jgi:hypothetical protein
MNDEVGAVPGKKGLAVGDHLLPMA